MEPIQAFGIAMIVFISMSPVLIVGIVVYKIMKLRHEQIMTAIEKGTPLADLVRPRQQPTGPIWIKYLSLGVGILITSFGFLSGGRGFGPVLAFGVMGFGACWIVRGYLYRKHDIGSGNSSEATAAIESGPTEESAQ